MTLVPRFVRLALLLAMGQLATAFVTAAEPDGTPRQPQIVAHRGLLLHSPEDTLSNFRACLELRLGFEFDVQRTKDGHLICIHDNTVDRTTNGTGPVAEKTLDEIRRLDAGSWFGPEFAGERVPTIDEILALIAAHPRADVVCAVDIKSVGVERELIRLAKQYNVLDRLLFIGTTIGQPAVRKSLRDASPESHTATVANHRDEFAAALAAADSDWVYVRYLPTREEVLAVHKAGKHVFIAGTPVVGANLPDNWKRATEAGVDAILTDHPLKLRAVLRQQD